ncbi:MAG: putative DNA-binding domain-containing protein [Bacteriovorax sp.]|nr:putative DNA-binding domain-containing protein [Bacteriovorax sp.]
MKQKDFNQKFVGLVRTPNSVAQVELIDLIIDGPKLSGARALEVYQEDYSSRLTEALKNTYRAINNLIGDEDFLSLSLDYIKIVPSYSSDLDDYGNLFSKFLTTHTLSDDYLFLSELADFEWNHRLVFHLEQEFGLDSLALISLIKDEDLKVQLVDSARVLNYHYLISDLYALKDSNSQEEHEFDFQIPQSLLMIKNDLVVKTHVLSKNQWEIMNYLLGSNSLTDLFLNVPASVTPEEIQSLFQILGSDRLLKRII